MKNLFPALVAIIILVLVSCKKDDTKYCWDCTQYEVISRNDGFRTIDSLRTQIFCGIPANEVHMFEHEILTYQDAFMSIYSVQDCVKSETTLEEDAK